MNRIFYAFMAAICISLTAQTSPEPSLAGSIFHQAPGAYEKLNNSVDTLEIVNDNHPYVSGPFSCTAWPNRQDLSVGLGPESYVLKNGEVIRGIFPVVAAYRLTIGQDSMFDKVGPCDFIATGSVRIREFSADCAFTLLEYSPHQRVSGQCEAGFPPRQDLAAPLYFYWVPTNGLPVEIATSSIRENEKAAEDFQFSRTPQSWWYWPNRLLDLTSRR